MLVVVVVAAAAVVVGEKLLSAFLVLKAHLEHQHVKHYC